MKKINLFEEISRAKKMMGLLTESIVPANFLKSLISGADQALINNLDTVLQRKFPAAFTQSVNQMTDDELRVAIRSLGRGGLKKFLTIAIDEKLLNAKSIGDELFTSQPGSNTIVNALGQGVDVDDILRSNAQITEDLPQDVIDWWMYNCRKAAFPGQNVPSPDDIAAQSQTGGLNIGGATSDLDDFEQFVKARMGNPKFADLVKQLNDKSLWPDLTPAQKKMLLYDVEKNPQLLTMSFVQQKKYYESLVQGLKTKPKGIKKWWIEFWELPVEEQMKKFAKWGWAGVKLSVGVTAMILVLRACSGANEYVNRAGDVVGNELDALLPRTDTTQNRPPVRPPVQGGGNRAQQGDLD